MTIGNYFAGDGLYNIRVGIYGIKISYRFIAKDTVPVNKIMYFNAYSFDKSGYHSGNGGKIRIEIQTNGTNNVPSGNVLCVGLVDDPLNNPKQLIVNFDKTAILNKNEVYHVVFSNYDVDPSINYVSVNTMSKLTQQTNVSPNSPELYPLDMTVLICSDFSGWERFKPTYSIIPIFSLFFEISDFGLDSISCIGYTGIESWVREPRQIAGTSCVRQKFTSYKNDKISSVILRVAKNGNPKDLYVDIYEGPKLLSSGSVDNSNVPKIDVNTQPGYRIGHDWVTINLINKVKLNKGKDYTIVFTSVESKDGSYEVFPLRDGSEFGYPSVWPNSWCEYKVNGGNWVGWDAWGNNNLKSGLLQLYLK